MRNTLSMDLAEPTPNTDDAVASPDIPDYLRQTYWWAYLHPRAVRIFEHQWIVNLILWGNFARLRDSALDELGPEMGAAITGRTLQVACVYGDFTPKLAERLSPIQTTYAYRVRSADVDAALPTDSLVLEVGNLLDLPVEIVSLRVGTEVIAASPGWVQASSLEATVPPPPGAPAPPERD